MSVQAYTKLEDRIIKEFYPLNQVDVIVNYTGRSRISITQRASTIGSAILRKYTNHSNKSGVKRVSNAIKAKAIELFVNNPSITKKEAKENGINYDYFRYINLWLPYKGNNGIVLVLGSKV